MMRKIISVTPFLVIALVFAFGTAYAAKPETLPNKAKAFGWLAKEERKPAIEEMQQAKKAEKGEKTKAVTKVYLYEPDTEALEEGSPWSKGVVNNKKGMYVLNAHYLAEGEYIVFYDSVEIGRGMANEYGDLHIKGEMPEDVTEIDPVLFELNGGEGGTTLVGYTEKVKPVKVEEETE